MVKYDERKVLSTYYIIKRYRIQIIPNLNNSKQKKSFGENKFNKVLVDKLASELKAEKPKTFINPSVFASLSKNPVKLISKSKYEAIKKPVLPIEEPLVKADAVPVVIDVSGKEASGGYGDLETKHNSLEDVEMKVAKILKDSDISPYTDIDKVCF